MINKIIDLFHLQYRLSKYKWYRKRVGGVWYYIDVQGLCMANVWCQKEITICQAKTIKTENYDK